MKAVVCCGAPSILWGLNVKESAWRISSMWVVERRVGRVEKIAEPPQAPSTWTQMDRW